MDASLQNSVHIWPARNDMVKDEGEIVSILMSNEYKSFDLT